MGLVRDPSLSIHSITWTLAPVHLKTRTLVEEALTRSETHIHGVTFSDYSVSEVSFPGDPEILEVKIGYPPVVAKLNGLWRQAVRVTLSRAGVVFTVDLGLVYDFSSWSWVVKPDDAADAAFLRSLI